MLILDDIKFSKTAAAKSLQSCLTLCDPTDGSPRGSPVPGILQARTQVGCHFLLPCLKGKSGSEVAQSCPPLSDPIDFSLPGSSVHGIFQARVPEWGAIAFSDEQWYWTTNHWGLIDGSSDSPQAKSSDTCVCVCPLSRVQLFVTPWTIAHQAPVHRIFQARILEWVAISSSRGSSQPRDQKYLLCLLHWQVDSLPLNHLGSIIWYVCPPKS